MNDYKNKNIFFTGRTNLIDLEELEKYLLQKGAVLVDSIQKADIVIKGKFTPIVIEEELYELSLTQLDILEIDKLEEEFSKNLDIDSILVAIKISKNQERLIKLLSNEYFEDEIFIKLLSLYDFKNEDIYDTDENRDVCTKIVERFCSLVETNHNIQYAPIGVYYTALEANSSKLLEVIYNMPDFSISSKNAYEDQPLSLKEVVALNPNSSKSMHLQIIKNNRVNELKFLALNEAISPMIQKKLFEKGRQEVNLSLIKASNYDDSMIEEFLDNDILKKQLFKTIKLDENSFEKFFENIDDISLIYLSMNSSLTSEMIDKAFAKNIDNSNINLLKNKNCPKNRVEEFLKKEDKIYNISLAHNEALNQEQFDFLYSLNDYDVNISLASNIKTPSTILKDLSLKEDRAINEILCANTSTPIGVLLQFQYDGGLKSIISNNDSFREFTRKNIGM
ncbi:hypothetical protein ACH5BF_10040 [Arcobacter sp. YIC-464]|uniref:hypothetical protein n=1 Tax=Arcobacter sp. YIC-464 TaxID=3376631 RepID=UPI003C259753